MLTVNEIAKLVGGNVIGDGKVRIKDMVSSAFAKEGDLTYAFDEEELVRAGKSSASCVLSMCIAENYPKAILQVDNIKKAMTVLYNAMVGSAISGKGTVHPTAIMAETAELGSGVSVGAHAVIGENTRIAAGTVVGAKCVIGSNVCIGESSCLYPNVTIYDRSVIGCRVILHAGAVIGADGFGYIIEDNKVYKVPQLGNVIIEDDVEVGANACIDKGTFDTTVLGRGTKIDNHVQIAHNVKIGKNVLIAALTGIGGSATVGDNTLVGGMVGIADHVNIGRDVKIGAKTGVHGNVVDGATIFGYPERNAGDARKQYALLSLLIKHMKKFRKFLRELPEG